MFAGELLISEMQKQVGLNSWLKSTLGYKATNQTTRGQCDNVTVDYVCFLIICLLYYVFIFIASLFRFT